MIAHMRIREIKSVFPCTAVLCKADVTTIENRLLQRYQQGDAKAKVTGSYPDLMHQNWLAHVDRHQDIRKSLGELDHAYIAKVHEKYAELEQDGWFDYILDSTAPSEQVVDKLLHTLQRAAVIHAPADQVSGYP